MATGILDMRKIAFGNNMGDRSISNGRNNLKARCINASRLFI